MDDKTIMRVRQMPMSALLRKVTGARDRNYLDLPETAEIWSRLPNDLMLWFGLIMRDLEDPLALRCSPIDKSDHGYFEIWRGMRDRNHPETRPGYQPPKNTGNGIDDDDDGEIDDELLPMPKK